jgi:hypothetical protein
VKRKPTPALEPPRWTGAKHCPSCNCSPRVPCIVLLPPPPKGEAVDEDVGEGQCVPAGVFGFDVCSGCQQSREVGYRVHTRAVGRMVDKALLTLGAPTP